MSEIYVPSTDVFSRVRLYNLASTSIPDLRLGVDDISSREVMTTGTVGSGAMEPHAWWDSIDKHSDLERKFRTEMQTPRVPNKDEVTRSRVAILQFGNEGHFDTQFCDNFETLKKYLPSPNERCAPILVILEDLDQAWVEQLGSTFRIPPYFFALHWALPLEHETGRAWLPVGQSPERHFIFRYNQMLPSRIVSNVVDSMYRLNSNVLRTIDLRRRARPSELGDGETCEQLVSYWGVPSYGGSWAAVLLVDPCPDIRRRRVEYDGKFGLRPAPPLELGSEEPGIMTTNIPSRHSLSVESADAELQQHNNGTRSAHPLSIFDELTSAVFRNLPQKPRAPLEATYTVCRVILARTADVVDQTMMDVNKLTADAAAGVRDIRNFSVEDIDISGWSGKWKGQFFTDLWEMRVYLELLKFNMDKNLNIVKRIEEIREDTQSSENLRKYARDLWEWEDLQMKLEYAFKMLERTSSSYVDAVQATAAQFANDQATSARRITGFATIFVPASLCAAVLAIPSFAGASDTEKFWIFWTVSVPLGILAWIWFISPLRGWISKTRDDFRRLKTDNRYGDRRDYLKYLFKARIKESKPKQEVVPKRYSETPQALVHQRMKKKYYTSESAV